MQQCRALRFDALAKLIDLREINHARVQTRFQQSQRAKLKIQSRTTIANLLRRLQQAKEAADAGSSTARKTATCGTGSSDATKSTATKTTRGSDATEATRTLPGKATQSRTAKEATTSLRPGHVVIANRNPREETLAKLLKRTQVGKQRPLDNRQRL